MTEPSIEARLRVVEQRLARLEQPRTSAGPRASNVERALRSEAAAALEAKLGTYWLSRLGIVSLITGIALLVITHFGGLAMVARVALGYAIAGAIGWAGFRLRPSHRMLGELVLGGGLAIAYFVTYALHFVPAMHVIDSEVIGVIAVALAIGGIVIVAHRLQSETVAGIALFLGLHTGMLSEVTALSLVAVTLLAAGAAFFLAANRWVIVPLSTVVAVYTTHAQLSFDDSASADLRLAFVAIDLALFAGASLRHPGDGLVRAVATLNWLGALVLGAAALADRGRPAVFAGGAVLAAIYVGLAVVAWRRKAPPAYLALHAGIAIATLGIALPAQLGGGALVVAWLALAVIAGAVARRADARFGALAALLILGAYVVTHDADLGAPWLLACIGVGFALERLHAPAAQTSTLRLVLVAAVAMGLCHVATVALPSGFQTLGAVGIGAALFAVGFALQRGAYRWAAFAVLARALLGLVDELGAFSPNQRITTFVLGGIALLVVSYLYGRGARRPYSERNATATVPAIVTSTTSITPAQSRRSDS